MVCLSDDVFRIIMQFTFRVSITHNQLFNDIERVQIFRECIADEFLCICSFDKHLQQHVCNPYRSFSPYYYTPSLDLTSIFGNAMSCLSHCLSKAFFDRMKSYRLIFLRYARAFQLGDFQYFNKLLVKYLIYIQTEDILHLRKSQRDELIKSLDLCSPLPHYFF
jgi:hypothetical protein